MRAFTVFFTLMAAASLGSLGFPEPAAAQEADIVGNWVLNRDKSDDPREVMARSRRDGRQIAPPAGASGTTRTRGSGSRPPRRAGGANQSGAARGPGPADVLLQQRLMSSVAQLSITKTDSSYVFASDGQQFNEYFFDGRKIKVTVGTELEVELKAEWKKNRLEVETKVTGGVKLKEKYEIDKDSGELRVELEFTNSRMRQRFKIKQVYEREEGG